MCVPILDEAKEGWVTEEYSVDGKSLWVVVNVDNVVSRSWNVWNAGVRVVDFVKSGVYALNVCVLVERDGWLSGSW